MAEAIQLTTPEGRIVWGDPHSRKPVLDDNTKQQKINAAGEPRFVTSFGLAIPKDQFAPVWDAMQRAAQAEFPNGIPPVFAWKYKDGDTDLDGKGNPLRNKEGYAGCYVLNISSELPVSVKVPQNGQWVDTASGVKTGDYVRAAVSFKGHQAKGMGKPGIYVNPDLVALYRVGEAINNGGVDPDEAFGAAPADAGNVPAAMPMPGQATNPAPIPTAPAGMPGQAVAGVPGAQTASPGNVQPAHDFVQNAGMPGVQTVPSQAAMPGMPGQGAAPGQAAMPGMPGHG